MNVEKLQSSGDWQAARDQFFATLDGEGCAAALASLVERHVCALYQQASAASAVPTALFAVGGFGRGLLFPHSDIDLLFLHHDSSPGERAADIVRPLTQQLWDQGLEPSHSVRPLREISQFQADNTELYLSLLDARPLAGSPELIAAFAEARRQLLAQKRERITARLFDLIDGRWRKFDNTIHHLEPDLKDGPGGLRDLHSIEWLSLLTGETPFWSQPERWPCVRREAMRHFAAARCFLHFQEGRNLNVMRFDAQEEWLELAARRGTGADEWVRRHYRTARTLYRELSHWTQRFSRPTNALQLGINQWLSRLSNADFSVSRGMLYVKVPHRLESEPALAWKLFEYVGRHNLSLAWDTVERLRRACEAQPPVPPAATLLRVLSTPWADRALRAMERTGYLTHLFPEWEDIDSLLVRDYYHRYTVDEHTLVCIDALCELMRGRQELDPRMRSLAEQTAEQDRILLALIFHDIGKKQGVEGHQHRSRVLAKNALARIGVDAEISHQVQALIEQHLLLSVAMRTRDLSDPATGAYIAEHIESFPLLRMLTLMTYADIRGVFPGALTPWRADQLWSSFRVAQLALEDRVAQERIPAAPSFSHDEQHYLEGFSTRYLRVFLPEQVREHQSMYRQLAQGSPALKLRAAEAGFELTAVCQDAPRLFAEVTGVLAGTGLNILLADAFRNAHGVLLLRFQFEDPQRSFTLNPTDQDRLLQRLERVLYHGESATAVLPRRGPSKVPSARRQMEPYVYARNEVSPHFTMFEFGAPDRPGLLYDVARTLAETGCTIDVLIVETRAHRAYDTVYVQKDGRELSAEAQAEVLAALRATLRGAVAVGR